MIREAIQNLNKQFEYQPKIENESAFQPKERFIIAGMGGSNLAGGIIESWESGLDVILHRDYGLPNLGESDIKGYLIVASSYSGNTEETISSFKEARSQGLPLVVIAAGGKLVDLAKEHGVSYIQIPNIGNYPRLAIGYSIIATLVAMGNKSVLDDIRSIAASFSSDDYEKIGKELASRLQNKIPIIYSSGNNAGLARYWKISFNETSKIPAFYNFIPELNHNEMVGFSEKTDLTDRFVPVFIVDSADGQKIQKRAEITKKLFEDRGFTVLDITLDGSSPWRKTFSGITTAAWASLHLAEYYGVDPEEVAMIENFKKLIVS